MFIKQELADIQSENMYNEHYENKIETNTENAQSTTVTELKDVEEEILHTDETEYNTDNTKTEVEEDEVVDVNNVSVVMENEDYKELYKCHIIKEELVVGPTIVQEDGIESEVSDLPSSSVVSLTCLPDTSVSELKTTAAKHVCLLCNKSFVNNSNLQRHLQHLHNQKTFDCEICSIKFTTKLLLDKHFLRHTEERPFNCDECGKKFKTKSNLFQHKRLHFKSHMCELCHKTFALRNEHPNATYECKDTEASIASKVWDEFVKKKTDNQSSTVNKIAH
ncbi:uncharacterized protein ACR2FA_010953 [Aphomia sociella]